MSVGVSVESYYIYNGIYTSKEFTRDLHGKIQKIKTVEWKVAITMR